MSLANIFNSVFRKSLDRKLHRLEKKSGMKLTCADFDPSDQNVRTIIQLRAKIRDADIEIIRLELELADNVQLQKENPAVGNAWEQYQLLLKLAKIS